MIQNKTAPRKQLTDLLFFSSPERNPTIRALVGRMSQSTATSGTCPKDMHQVAVFGDDGVWHSPAYKTTGEVCCICRRVEALATIGSAGQMSGARSSSSNYGEFRVGEPGNAQNRARVQRKGRNRLADERSPQRSRPWPCVSCCCYCCCRRHVCWCCCLFCFFEGRTQTARVRGCLFVWVHSPQSVSVQPDA